MFWVQDFRKRFSVRKIIRNSTGTHFESLASKIAFIYVTTIINSNVKIIALSAFVL